jgi:hypothetical protein
MIQFSGFESDAMAGLSAILPSLPVDNAAPPDDDDDDGNSPAVERLVEFSRI